MGSPSARRRCRRRSIRRRIHTFTGAVVATGRTLAADDGVDTAEGAAQLTAQKAHLEIATTSVVFTS